MNQIDFVASIASLLDIGIASDEAVDSRDNLDALLGKSPDGLPFMLEEAGRAIGIRKGPWKYIVSNNPNARTNKGKKGMPQLYNLDDDIGEQNNIIAEHPETAKELAELIKKLKSSGRTRP